MKKKIILILLPCFLLSGCVKQSEYDALQKKYDSLEETKTNLENAYLKLSQDGSMEAAMLTTCFGDDVIAAPLDDERTMYQIILDYYDECATDFGKNLAEFVKIENADSQYSNNILCIYYTAVNETGSPVFGICMKRDQPGGRFVVVE